MICAECGGVAYFRMHWLPYRRWLCPQHKRRWRAQQRRVVV